MIAATLMAMMLAQAAPADAPPPGAGPRGTSQAFGAARYDAVGYASWYGEEMRGATASGQRFDASAITAAHPSMPIGSFAEVTALDSGRTILVLITDRGPRVAGRIIDLSRAAAQLLGVDARPVSAVRVRQVDPPPTDQTALRSGRAGSARLDTPPQLLAALRRKLPGSGAQQAAPQPTPRLTRPSVAMPMPAPPPGRAGGTFVQVATFSSMARAEALAATLGGFVQPAGALYRVRLGPFDPRAAEEARDAVARRGYGDARLVQE